VSRSSLTRARELALGALAALAGFGIASSPGCGTDAKGVEDCREIERARCDAAAACGRIEDIGSCQRFYRDHCLHRILADPPSPEAVDRCVRTIQTAGSCASTQGADAALSACVDPSRSLAASGALTACDLVLYPERADSCAFLAPNTSRGGNEAGASGADGS
jgi:hypothetical protein